MNYRNLLLGHMLTSIQGKVQQDKRRQEQNTQGKRETGETKRICEE